VSPARVLRAKALRRVSRLKFEGDDGSQLSEKLRNFLLPGGRIVLRERENTKVCALLFSFFK